MIKYKFVWRNSAYFQQQGKEFYERDRILICLYDIETKIYYPHPITSFLHINYHRNSGSVNTERTAAIHICPFLNFILQKVKEGHKEFVGIGGLCDLEVKHADLYLENCVEEKASRLNTLEAKENYLSTFYRFLSDQNILKKKPNFTVASYLFSGKSRTVNKLVFNYQKTDETLMRIKIKRKDMVPQKENMKADRKTVRLNYIREFLLVAKEIVPDIAFGIALQFYAGLRAGEVLNLLESSLICQEGGEYGQRGLLLLIRDRQRELFSRKKSRAEEQVKRPRDQSVLIDPILCFLFEHHKTKVLPNLKENHSIDALLLDKEGNPMSYKTYYDRFCVLKSYYLGILQGTSGRYQDYKDFLDTNWSTHIGRGAFTNMCLDAGFSAAQTAILRGDKSTWAMDAYRDVLSASYNISRALGLLEPENAEQFTHLNVPISHKYWKEVEKLGSTLF